MILLQAGAASLGPYEGLTNFGIAGICILALGGLSWVFIKNMMAKQSKLEDFVINEMKAMNENMVKVVVNNNDALREIKEEIKDLKDTMNDFRIEIERIKKG
jgi:uncharacterized protein HemX